MYALGVLEYQREYDHIDQDWYSGTPEYVPRLISILFFPPQDDDFCYALRFLNFRSAMPVTLPKGSNYATFRQQNPRVCFFVLCKMQPNHVERIASTIMMDATLCVYPTENAPGTYRASVTDFGLKRRKATGRMASTTLSATRSNAGC